MKVFLQNVLLLLELIIRVIELTSNLHVVASIIDLGAGIFEARAGSRQFWSTLKIYIIWGILEDW